MSRRQFASAVGADENWVVNSARRLGVRLNYTPDEARTLRLARILSHDFGMRLANAARVAARAFEDAEPTATTGGGIVLARAGDLTVTILLDHESFRAHSSAALSSSLTFERRKRAGRKQPSRQGGRAITRARRRRLDLGMLRLSLGRPVARRLAYAGYGTDDPEAGFVARLVRAEAGFVLAGEIAEVAHGATPIDPTRGEASRLVVCYDSSPANIDRLLGVLHATRARPRGVETFTGRLAPATFRAVSRLSLDTSHGTADLVDTLPGIGGYGEALAMSEEVDVAGSRARVLTLPGLTVVRRRAGAPDDVKRVVELEALAALPGTGRPIGVRRSW